MKIANSRLAENAENASFGQSLIENDEWICRTNKHLKWHEKVDSINPSFLQI
jgi:hypothetical protein